MSGIRASFGIERSGFRLDVDLSLPGQGVTALFGHSGSGKTTLLRAIAGLERAPGGYFALGDEVWQDERRGLFVPTHLRPLGYVFQEASLFDHLSVEGNLEFGRRRIPEAERRFRPAEVAELLGIGSLLGAGRRACRGRAAARGDRPGAAHGTPAAADGRAAGGPRPQAQARDPALPRAPPRRAGDPHHLRQPCPGRGRPAGRPPGAARRRQVVASGPLTETLARADLPPAFADDAGVVVAAVVAAHEADDLTRLDFAGGSILVARRPEAIGHRLRCRIHARDVSLALDKPQASSILNVFRATVSAIAATDTPGQVLVQLYVGATPLLARITERSRRVLDLQVGREVWAQVKAVALLA
jgi:molybdate transport system ATP-binding protein